jgi:HlyD family type I secretion membrane fusion protein
MLTTSGEAPPVPTKLFPIVLVGLGVMTFTLGGLAAWSYLAPLSSAAMAPGVVVVASNRKAIQHLEGGTIKAILVNDGDRVAAGQLLVQLDDARLSADLAALKPLIQMNWAVRARLMAERRGSAEIEFPPDATGSTDPNQLAILDDQRKLFAARRSALDSARASLVNQREQAEVQIAGLQSQIESLENRFHSTEEELNGIDKLAKKGFSPRKRVMEYGRALEEIKGEQAKLRAMMGEKIKQAELSTLEIRRITDLNAQDVETEFQKVETERHKLSQGMLKLNEQLDRLRVVAPVAGTVVNRAVHTIGGVVASGDTLLEIVPEGDPLLIEARVRPTDVEGLEIGMPVEIRFPGLQERLLPRLHGRLLTLSADLAVDGNGKTSYYLARAEVDDEALRLLGRQNLRPGMPVDIMLIKESRTVVQYLLGPLGDFLSRAMRE